MNVFESALATIHADPNVGMDVEFSVDGVSWRAIRASYAQASDETGLNMRASAEHLSVVAAQFVAAPVRNNRVRYPAGSVMKTYLIKAVDPDILNFSWRLTLTEFS